jgi:hypothetical protein
MIGREELARTVSQALMEDEAVFRIVEQTPWEADGVHRVEKTIQVWEAVEDE